MLHNRPDLDMPFYGIFLFQSSTSSCGISKSSGKPWKKVEVELSDGVRTIYIPIWDREKAFGWLANTPVIVYGFLKTDWRGRPTMSTKDISRLQDIPNRRK